MSLKLEERPFDIDGHTYILRCNMAVLDAMQDAHGGDFNAILSMSNRDVGAEVLAAMLNDYAEDMGWPTDWTVRKVKKSISYAQLLEADVLGIFGRAVAPPNAENAAQESETKN